MADLVVQRAPLLVAVRGVLRAGGRRCEIGQPPVPSYAEPPPGGKPKPNYTIVYGIDGGEFYGTLEEPDGCALAIVQLTHVTTNARDCERAADEARRILLGRSGGFYVISLDSDGQQVTGRRSLGMGAGDSDGALATLHERYEFFVSA